MLRGCPDVEYTIVRPGVMSTLEEDDTPPASLALADDGGDLKVCVRRATAFYHTHDQTCYHADCVL